MLLVTSTTRKRWIIPKGYVEDDLGVVESARLEAYEEAGIRGSIRAEPLGRYEHDRVDRPSSVVEVYLMNVDLVLPDESWPEHGFRKRTWMSFDDAREAVLEDGLKEIFRRAAAILSE